MRYRIVALGFALLVLNVLDLVITRLNIQKLGGVEANALIAPIIATPPGTILKIGIPLWIIFLAVWVESARAVTFLRVAVAVYVVVVIIGVGQFAYATM